MRSCIVDGRVGYFHCWEHYSRPLEASPLIGGAPAGVFSQVYAIVEFVDRCERVPIVDIIFNDDEHAMLETFQACYDEKRRVQHD